jgi:hypothetical protein
MITKQGFEDIAKLIKRARDVPELAGFLAAYFKEQNPKFDVQRFIKACTK